MSRVAVAAGGQGNHQDAPAGRDRAGIPAQPGTFTISARTVDNGSRTGPTTTSNLTIN